MWDVLNHLVLITLPISFCGVLIAKSFVNIINAQKELNKKELSGLLRGRAIFNLVSNSIIFLGMFCILTIFLLKIVLKL